MPKKPKKDKDPDPYVDPNSGAAPQPGGIVAGGVPVDDEEEDGASAEEEGAGTAPAAPPVRPEPSVQPLPPVKKPAVKKLP